MTALWFGDIGTSLTSTTANSLKANPVSAHRSRYLEQLWVTNVNPVTPKKT